MKQLILVAVLVLFGGQVAQAGISTSVEVLPVGVGGDQIMITPDYFAKVRDVAFYGFVEYSGDAGGWFTNHGATWMPTDHVGAYGEVGLDDAGGSYFSLGPSFSLPVPGFAYLKATPKWVVGTPERSYELNLVWKTKGVPAFGGSVWTEGFIRTLRDAGNTYGQPQVWYRRNGTTWDFGLEVEVIGGDRTARAGIRKSF